MTDLLGLTNVERPMMPFTIEPKRAKVYKGIIKSAYPKMSSEQISGFDEFQEAVALSLQLPQPASSSHEGHAPYVDQDGVMTYSIYGNAANRPPRLTYVPSPKRGVKGQLNEIAPPVPAKRPRPEQDLDKGFRDAYAGQTGLAYDDKNKVLYIAGMRANPNDVVAGWDSAFNPAELKNTRRWQDTVRFLSQHPEVKLIRGHSMGGVVASQMASILKSKRYAHVKYESYNSPFSPINVPNPKLKRWRHVGDLVSLQDAGAEEVNFGNFWDLLAQHDYAGFSQ